MQRYSILSFCTTFPFHFVDQRKHFIDINQIQEHKSIFLSGKLVISYHFVIPLQPKHCNVTIGRSLFNSLRYEED